MPPIVLRILFAVAQSRGVGIAVRWTFSHAAFALPLRRAAETPWAVAFPHPRPGWPLHTLVVPKTGVASLLDPSSRADDAVARMVDLAAALSTDRHSSETPDRVAFLINAGAFQDIPQLHGHLIAAPDLFDFHAGARSATPLWSRDGVAVSRVSPGWRHEHVVLVSHGTAPRERDHLPHLLAVARKVARHSGADEAGFAVVWSGDRRGIDWRRLHLVAHRPLRLSAFGDTVP